ncbi:MAG TPA: FTR1 family protein [Candidatus Limnocylindria bacterium]|nr:FTR1 family protein [Candidatus Limnocylindria bacterium]
MSAADISALVIALREGVEMTLIVGIVLAYLGQIGAQRARRWVWAGVGLAVVASLSFLGVLNVLDKEFEGSLERIYEGGAMLLAAAFLTWMIFWMLQRSRYLKSELQSGVAEALASGGAAWGLLALAFFTVVREGVETALLLFAAPGEGKLLGAAIGFAIAIGVGVLIYVYGRRIDLRSFFRVTGIVLVLFAAGLVTHGLHELVEAGLPGGPVVFDIGAQLPDKDGLGAVLRALLGYSADPTVLEVAAYLGYFVLVWVLSKTKIIGRMAPRVSDVRPTA